MATLIPPDALESATLNNIIEEFVTRDGTDYGNVELSLKDKTASLRLRVMRGEVLIVYDEAADSVNLVEAKLYEENV